MRAVLIAVLATVRSSVRSRAELEVEILALRHQLAVLQRAAPKRLRLTRTDRLLWAWLSQTWRAWRSALAIVKPETVLAWHRKGFRLFWTWKIQRGLPGRPAVSRSPRPDPPNVPGESALGCTAYPRELLKLGIAIGETV
jgi:hypothetical protein